MYVVYGGQRGFLSEKDGKLGYDTDIRWAVVYPTRIDARSAGEPYGGQALSLFDVYAMRRTLRDDARTQHNRAEQDLVHLMEAMFKAGVETGNYKVDGVFYDVSRYNQVLHIKELPYTEVT